MTPWWIWTCFLSINTYTNNKLKASNSRFTQFNNSAHAMILQTINNWTHVRFFPLIWQNFSHTDTQQHCSGHFSSLFSPQQTVARSVTVRLATGNTPHSIYITSASTCSFNLTFHLTECLISARFPSTILYVLPTSHKTLPNQTIWSVLHLMTTTQTDILI
jgi:hypothetical protein